MVRAERSEWGDGVLCRSRHGRAMTAHRRPEIRFTDAPRGVCRWCGEPILHLDGAKAGEPNLRRRWHPECVEAYNDSDPREVRRRLRKRDRGLCASCGLDTLALKKSLKGRGMARALRERGFVPRRSLWEVDHIVPLVDGGGHDMTNLQSLCTPCHKRKTAAEATARALKPKPRPEEKPGPSSATEITEDARRTPQNLDQEAALDPLLRRAEALNHRVEDWLSQGPHSTRSSDEA